MNKKTIRALYLGKIHPEHSHGYKTEVYKEHTEEYTKLYDEIAAELSDECRRKFDMLMDEFNAAQGEIVIDAFVSGFELGVSLTAEGLLRENE